MTLVARFYWLDDDGRPQRFVLTRFDAVTDGKLPVPEWAGKTVRVLQVLYEVRNRKAVSLIAIHGFQYSFDARGFFDRAKNAQYASLDDRGNAELAERQHRGRSSLSSPTPKEIRVLLDDLKLPSVRALCASLQTQGGRDRLA
jgi:hypothetical protein